MCVCVYVFCKLKANENMFTLLGLSLINPIRARSARKQTITKTSCDASATTAIATGRAMSGNVT